MYGSKIPEGNGGMAASYPTQTLFIGALQSKDRKAAGYTSSAAESSQATQARASYTGGLTSYGGPTYLALGNGGGGGRVTARSSPGGTLDDAITRALDSLR
jgi:hypothetical protein